MGGTRVGVFEGAVVGVGVRHTVWRNLILMGPAMGPVLQP